MGMTLKEIIKNKTELAKNSLNAKVEKIRADTLNLMEHERKDNNIAKSTLSIASLVLTLIIYSVLKYLDFNGFLSIMIALLSQVAILSALHYWRHKNKNKTKEPETNNKP